MHRENGYLSQEGLYPTNYIHRGVRHVVQRAALWTAKHEFRDCRVVVARQPVSDCVFSFCDKEGVPEAKLVCSSSFFFFYISFTWNSFQFIFNSIGEIRIKSRGQVRLCDGMEMTWVLLMASISYTRVVPFLPFFIFHSTKRTTITIWTKRNASHFSAKSYPWSLHA